MVDLAVSYSYKEHDIGYVVKEMLTTTVKSASLHETADKIPLSYNALSPTHLVLCLFLNVIISKAPQRGSCVFARASHHKP